MPGPVGRGRGMRGWSQVGVLGLATPEQGVEGPPGRVEPIGAAAAGRWRVVGGLPGRGHAEDQVVGAQNPGLWSIPGASRMRSCRQPRTSRAGTENSQRRNSWVWWGWPTAASRSPLRPPPAAAWATYRSPRTVTAEGIEVRLVAIAAAVCQA